MKQKERKEKKKEEEKEGEKLLYQKKKMPVGLPRI